VNKAFPSLTEREQPSREWLLKTQDPSGGWAEHPGSHLSSLNTAEVIIGLVGSGVDAGHAQIQKAIEFLETDHVDVSAPDGGAWCRRVKGRLVPDIMRTCVIVRALISGGRGVAYPVVAAALAWLLARQNTGADDRGWGFRRGDKSELLPTCFALRTLMRISDASTNDRWKKPITDALEQLKRFRKPDGSFGEGVLKAPHTLQAVLVLQTARVCEFPIVATTEVDALKWLLLNQDDALAPVEETLPIETDRSGDGNYGYTFPMYAGLLQAIAGSTVEQHRKTTLWTDVQRFLSRDFDEPTGAFFGSRAFSWSTASALYSIREAERFLRDVPARPEEDATGTKVGNWILGLAVLLFGGVVYLAQQQRFTPLVAIVFGFLMLACLLAYGRIREKTFGQLVGAVLSREAGSERKPAKE